MWQRYCSCVTHRALSQTLKNKETHPIVRPFADTAQVASERGVECIVRLLLHDALVAMLQHLPQALARKQRIVLAQGEEAQVQVEYNREQVQFALNPRILPTHLTWVRGPCPAGTIDEDVDRDYK